MEFESHIGTQLINRTPATRRIYPKLHSPEFSVFTKVLAGVAAMNDNDPFAKKLIRDTVKATESRIVDVNAMVRAIQGQYPQASKQEIMSVVIKLIQHFGLAARWE